MTRHFYDFGSFQISETPGQGQLAHCHGFIVHADKRGKGNGKKLKELQMAMLKLHGFDYATCTCDARNDAQQRILALHGWRILDVFHNTATGSLTQLWGCRVA